MVDPSRYLELVKKSLVNELYVEAEGVIGYLLSCLVQGKPVDVGVANRIRTAPWALETVRAGKAVGRTAAIVSRDADGREVVHHGFRGAMEVAHTMIGRARLDNLHACLDRIAADGVPGDLIETGVWRGGRRSSCAPG